VAGNSAGTILGAGGDTDCGETKLLTTVSVLLVEDDLMNQIIMQAKLQELPTLKAPRDSLCCEETCRIECVTVDTAEKAMELIKNGPDGQFDLVLMDQHLENAGGVLTGIEAVRELRSSGHTHPIIMCSGNCDARDSDGYLSSGASLVWPKPYPPTPKMASDLRALLCQPLSRPTAVRPAALHKTRAPRTKGTDRHVFI
jgi:CheY-like chemotaxis protein